MNAHIGKAGITLLLLFFALGATAQSVEFYYDASGNRITRTIVALKSAQVTDSVVADSTGTINPDVPKKNDAENHYPVGPTLYPNPTKGLLVLQLTGYETNPADGLWLSDAKGNLLQHIKTLSPELKIDLNRQPQGSYYIKALVAGKPYEWKIIKE